MQQHGILLDMQPLKILQSRLSDSIRPSLSIAFHELTIVSFSPYSQHNLELDGSASESGMLFF
jgi:hypothetical protein